MEKEMEDVASALAESFQKVNVLGDTVNVVQSLIRISESADRIAGSILPPGVSGNHDAAGGRVESLTESVMGITAALCKIADSISDLAEAVRGMK